MSPREKKYTEIQKTLEKRTDGEAVRDEQP
jgi:hypothetical protein